ncbi:MAG: DUF1800 family protein [Verrucomicrobiota bacterium]
MNLSGTDINENGQPDLVELLYPAAATLPPEGDEDEDGLSNKEERQAITDPFDARSRLQARIRGSDEDNGVLEVTVTSVPGRQYGLWFSSDLERWRRIGVAETAFSDHMTVAIDRQALMGREDERGFLRFAVTDIDTDGDGLDDALENYLGFDPANRNSARSAVAGGDYEQFRSLLDGGNREGGLFGTSQRGVPSPEQASRFLAQASFGPSGEKITAFRNLGPGAYGQWIADQIAVRPSYLRTYIDRLALRMSSDAAKSGGQPNPIFPHFVTRQTDFAMFRENVNTVWMRQALFAPDELRQRVAWALSQIVVVGPRCNSYGIAAADWYDTVIEHALGNYRDLLYDIAVHPWMGWYLSHLDNRKADPFINRFPDENFAREIMQLFSIGLWELNMDGTRKLDASGEPIPAYDNGDIVHLARVFTGLELREGARGQSAFAQAPMQMNEDEHDRGDAFSSFGYDSSEKRFLGAVLPTFANDPGRKGLDDVSAAIDVLIDHPNCPPFISKTLIQHLVTSNPSPAYVERVARVFAGEDGHRRGDLGATVRAILLDREARGLAAMLHPESGRLKGPMLRIASLARAFEAGSETSSLHDLNGIQFWSPRKDVLFGELLQYPFEYPSVFNFYETGYSRPGEIRERGLVSPEFAIMNPLTATTLPNRLWSFVEDGFHDAHPDVTPPFRIRIEPLKDLSEDTEQLLDRINLLLCHGMLSPGGRKTMREALSGYAPGTGQWRNRIELAISLALVSPDCAVLK